VAWEIEYYETERGKCPVEEFIDRLDVKSKAKLARTIDLLEQFGADLGMPYARHVEGELWELRTRLGSSQFRIIYSRSGSRTFILLHGFVKKTGRMPKRDLKIAKDRWGDFLSRKKRGQI